MSTANRARDVWNVARFELAESFRSRGVIALLTLYLAGAVGGAYVFVRIVRSIEEQLTQTMGLPPLGSPGASSGALFQSERFREMISTFTDNPELGRALAATPPLALFYGGLGFFFVPLLVVLTASDTAASELESGSARFALFRVERVSWALGKLLGQMILMAVGVAIGALGVWGVGAFAMSGFPKVDGALALASFALRVFLAGLPYLSLSLAVSVLSRRAGAARAGAILLLIGLRVGRGMLEWFFPPGHAAALLAITLGSLFPANHVSELWMPAWRDRAPAIVMLVALAGAYFSAAVLWFERRDA